MSLTSVIYQMLVRIYRILPLKLKKILVFLLKTSHIPFSKFYRDIRYFGNLTFKVDGNNIKMIATGGTIENEIFWRGIDNSLEPETIYIWKYLCKQGRNTIIDVGANSGLYCLLAASINPSLNIIAFEPSLNLYKKLVENIKINNFNIKAERIAISNEIGTKIFFDINDINQTNASLSSKMVKDNNINNINIIEYNVNITTLDDYVLLNKIRNVDLIKIDVELHEPEVFEGMMKLMITDKPFILFEVLVDEIANKLNRFFNSDYIIFEFISIKKDFFIKPINKLIAKPNGEWNYFACHKDRIDMIKDLILK